MYPRYLLLLSAHLHGLHLDVQLQQDVTPVDITEQWSKDWPSFSMVNHIIVTNAIVSTYLVSHDLC